MTVSELIAALSSLVANDDDDSKVAQMEVLTTTECGYVEDALALPYIYNGRVFV
jgi:hypothetical protein